MLRGTRECLESKMGKKAEDNPRWPWKAMVAVEQMDNHHELTWQWRAHHVRGLGRTGGVGPARDVAC